MSRNPGRPWRVQSDEYQNLDPDSFLIGRAAAMSDWHFRREQRDFERLVNRIRVANWQKANPEKRRANALRYAMKPENKTRNNANARRRRASKPTPVLVCRECGTDHVKRGRRGGTVPEFCSDRCRQRFRYQERTPGARRIRRQPR